MSGQAVFVSTCVVALSATSASLLPSAAAQAQQSPTTAPPTGPVISPSPAGDFWDDLELYGDFRLREEESFHLDGKKDRSRQRLRLRLGANYHASDELLLGTRVVTGDPDDPRSTHVTLGDAFDDLDISLDRAFLTWRPTFWEGGSATGGKFDHPFYENPVYGELVWDGDVQPEGAVLRQTIDDVGPLEGVQLCLGGYKLIEQSDAEDAEMLVSQVAASFRPSAKLLGTLAVGYYYYTNTTPGGSDTLLDDNSGNATVDENGDGDADDFVSDFGILNPIASLRYEGWDEPFVASAEFIRNTRADIDEDEGWAIGAAYGSAAKKGDWRFYYQWQVVEQDAVFSPFAQDDFLLTTNHRSHLGGVNYQVSEKLGLHLWALVSARDHTGETSTTDSDRDQWRVRLDLNLKF